MKYLGIDYGKKKMGLAVSEGISATPYKVVFISGLGDALIKTKEIILKEGIDKIIVGMPESGDARNLAKKFCNSLKKEFDVLEYDETLSSFKAKQKMIDLGKPKSKRRTEDAYAAAEILQEYLDNKS